MKRFSPWRGHPARRLFPLALTALLSLPAQAILDTNSNDLSDLWEREFNNNQLFPLTFDPQADPDGDGWTNEQEAAAGTNPFQANPPDGIIRPEILHTPATYFTSPEGTALLTPEAFTITWPTLTGKQYVLYASPDLTPGSWLPIGPPFIAAGGTTSTPIPITQSDGSTPEKLFWRVTAEDADTDTDDLTNAEEDQLGTDPGSNDTDGDGLADAVEVLSNLDPLNFDSDYDGYSDGEEVAVGTSPLDPTLFPLKVTHTVQDHLVENGLAYGHPSGQPLLLYLNQGIPASATTLAGPWLFETNGGTTLPAPGSAIILPGRKAIAFIPSGGSFKTWEDVADATPTYQVSFDTQTTGIRHLIPLNGTFTITSPEGSADHGPWPGEVTPGRNYIDADPFQPIRASWNEPLDPTTVIPGNLSLVAGDGTVIATIVGFDYGRNTNLMTITPVQPLSPATLYTVTLGAGFHNLTGKAHSAPQSWSFTTRPVRPVPGGTGPFVTAVFPADFSFGIAPPQSVSITFSEDMDPATLIPENIRIRGSLGNVLPGSYTYTVATRTLEFLPTIPFATHTYFSLEFDHENIHNLPESGNPGQLQDTGNSVFSTFPLNGAGGNAGGTDGNSTPSATALAPIRLHYTWGTVFAEPEGGSGGNSPNAYNSLPYVPPSGCSVDIRLTDKNGVATEQTLPPNAEAVRVADSGDIAPATTVMVTPVYAPGSREAESLAEKKKNGIFILPAAASPPLLSPPPGMTYLVFRKTPPDDGSTDPDTVEYLGPFGTRVEARCATAEGRGPQTLYFVPVPIEREIPGGQAADWNLLEGDYAKALPGQRMDLTVQKKYLELYGPPQTTIDTFLWPAADLGKTFKEFFGTSGFSIYHELIPGDLSKQTIQFYRTKGGDTMAAKATFQIKIAGAASGEAEAVGKIRMDQPGSSFGLEIGEEKVMTAPDNHWNLVPMFGLFSKTANQVFRGVKFKGMVKTPPGWSPGEWNYVQLIKSMKIYTYQGGLQTLRGDGQSLKLDTSYPYSITFAADGTPKDDDSCGDTPRDPLTGSPPPNQQSMPRTQIEAHESFETYMMFQPPGLDSRYVPLRKAKWQWGGIVTASNNWTPVTGREAQNSDASAVEHFDHPQWSDNTTSDEETANP